MDAVWLHNESQISKSREIAVVDTNADGKHYLHYILKDHLGSWTTITDSEGTIEQELSFDAWGNRRNPKTWTSPRSKTPRFFLSAYPYHPAWRYTLSYREIWGSR